MKEPRNLGSTLKFITWARENNRRADALADAVRRLNKSVWLHLPEHSNAYEDMAEVYAKLIAYAREGS